MAHLSEITKLFAKLGTFTFGGPAVYLAAMEDECVERRGWLTRQEFLDLLGVTYLLPGPNATEMAANLGYRRGGAFGAWAAGSAFTLPAVLITLALAWSYAAYGDLPAVAPLFRGIKPVVWAIVVMAAWRLGCASWKTRPLAALGFGAVVAVLLGVDEILVLVLGAFIGPAWLNRSARWQRRSAVCLLPLAFGGLATAETVAIPLWKLGLFFFKVGAVWYGGGYVLIAYLEGGLVRDLGVLTESQLMDAVAVGQITPGPFLSTITFIGYLLGGLPGGLVATVAILTPAALVIAITNPLVVRLRSSRLAAGFLDAVNAVCVGLTIAVCITLGRAVLVSGFSILLAVAAVFILARWKVQPVFLIAAGALLGLLMPVSVW